MQACPLAAGHENLVCRSQVSQVVHSTLFGLSCLIMFLCHMLLSILFACNRAVCFRELRPVSLRNVDARAKFRKSSGSHSYFFPICWQSCSGFPILRCIFLLIFRAFVFYFFRICRHPLLVASLFFCYLFPIVSCPRICIFLLFFSYSSSIFTRKITKNIGNEVKLRKK